MPRASLHRLRRSAHRRIAVVAVAAIGVVVSFPAGAAGSPAPSSANDFVESIGVNVHTFYNDSPYYTQFETVKQRLAELGVHHVRDGLMPNRPDEYRSLNALASIGVKSTLIMGDPSIGSEGLSELVEILNTQVRGAVDAVEGPNEYDTTGGPGWADALRSYQQQLYTAVKSNPSLAQLPVIGPSIVQKRNQEALGDISGSLDYGNVHSYPQGAPPEENVSSYLSRAADNSGSKPVMATETGYHNAMSWTGEQSPVSEGAAAVYMPRLFLYYFSRGIPRTFSYELVDSGTSQSERDSNWGLLRNDLSEKPAFTALRNLISILQDPGPAFTPEAADYTLSGDTSGLQQVLLQKRDGSYYLALWRAESVWDGASGTPLSPAPRPVSIEFDRQLESAERFEPNVSDASLGPLAPSEGRLTVPVGPQVTILRLHLGAQLSGRIKLWVSRRSIPAGGRLSIGGQLPLSARGQARAVALQRWSPSAHRWLGIGHGRANAKGSFKKTIRVPAGLGPVSRLRGVAASLTPSKPVRLRIRGGVRAPLIAVSAATAAQPYSANSASRG